MPTTTFKLTPEQEEIVRYVRNEITNPGVITRAGSSKTSTLVGMTRNIRERSARGVVEGAERL